MINFSEISTFTAEYRTHLRLSNNSAAISDKLPTQKKYCVIAVQLTFFKFQMDFSLWENTGIFQLQPCLSNFKGLKLHKSISFFLEKKLGNKSVLAKREY